MCNLHRFSKEGAGDALARGTMGVMTGAHPTVEKVVADAGYRLGDPASVRRMQAQHWRDIPPQDVELIQRRMDLGTDRALARARDRPQRPSSSSREVDHAILRVVAPIAHEIPHWRAWKEEGEETEVIAARSGVPAGVVRLVLDGIPGRPRETLLEEQLVEAVRRWRAGEDEVAVAAALDRSAGWLRRATRTGRLVLAPARMHRADLAEWAGVTTDLVGVWSRRGLLPRADGRDLFGRWWWRHTIETWAETSLPHSCPHCPARMPTETGLRVHTSKKHPR